MNAHHLLAANGGVAGGAFSEFLINIAIIAAYFAPSIVARLRHVPNLRRVFLVNLLLGWTLIGWVAALVIACRSAPERSPSV
jgi:hypothetical protein